MEGFGQWEFIALLWECLRGEAKDVLSAFLDFWDFDSAENENLVAAVDAERRRILWRTYRCDRCAFKSLRVRSGFDVEPVEPEEDEPRDLDRLIEDLQARFRSSSTENLALINNFRAQAPEKPERMFARFKILAKPLEDERPRVMTTDQLRTSYIFHLKSILSAAKATELGRDIRDAERLRDIAGRNQLTRHEIHEMVLRQDREEVIEENKLRAVGLTRIPVRHRLGSRMPEKREIARERRSHSPTPQVKPDTRMCHHCKIIGHISANCPDRAETRVALANIRREERRRPNNTGNSTEQARAKISTGGRSSSDRHAGPHGGRGGSTGGREGRAPSKFVVSTHHAWS